MIEKILNFKTNNNIERTEFEHEIIESKDARLMFLYLYYVSSDNIENISNEILDSRNYRYIHFLLRSFKFVNHTKLIDHILAYNDDPRYLYSILFDVDYLGEYYRLKLVNKIITFNNDKYTFQACYYYFVILNLYNEELYNKVKILFKEKFNIELDENNYKDVFDSILYKSEKDPDGFSKNCYEGRNGHIPNIIVCHINNTYNSAIKHFYGESEVSSHYIIRRDGHIKQVVDLDNSAWANGTSMNESSDVYYKFASSNLINTVADNANYFTFSIEHESFDGTLTDEQLKSTIKVMKKIVKYLKDKYNYDFPIDREHIIGHNEINPIVRTKCPGVNFPFEKIIKELKK